MSTSLPRRSILFLCLLFSGMPSASFGQDSLLTIGYHKPYGSSVPVEDFNASTDGTTLRGVRVSDWDLSSRHSYPASASELPDIVDVILMRENLNLLPHLIENGLIVPLNEILEELGIDPEDLMPNALEAVTYDGNIWALPHQIEPRCLVYRKDVFKTLQIEPRFNSWEALFKAAEIIADSDLASDSVVGFLQQYGTDPWFTAEHMALSVGEAPLELADLSFLSSDSFLAALQLLSEARERGAYVRSSKSSQSGRDAAGMAFSVTKDQSEDSAHGFLRFPNRIWEDDVPSTVQYMDGRLECFAIRTNTPGKIEAAKEFLRWLWSKDTQLSLVKKSPITAPRSSRFYAVPYLPLRKSVLDSTEFDAITEQTPAYTILREYCGTTILPKGRTELPREAVLKAAEILEKNLEGAGPRQAIASIREAIAAMVLTTEVESSAFDQY